MTPLKKICNECGMPLSPGLAKCENCGATVGTVFSEDSPPPVNPKRRQPGAINKQADFYDLIERAQERANNSVILALASFFCPGVGFILGISAIIMSLMAAQTLRVNNVEEGRGSAAAGLVIGVLGLIAQGGYVVYVIKSGKLPLLG
jgi:uncharacterized Zn finger protein (UPF0148 family)